MYTAVAVATNITILLPFPPRTSRLKGRQNLKLDHDDLQAAAIAGEESMGYDRDAGAVDRVGGGGTDSVAADDADAGAGAGGDERRERGGQLGAAGGASGLEGEVGGEGGGARHGDHMAGPTRERGAGGSASASENGSVGASALPTREHVANFQAQRKPMNGSSSNGSSRMSMWRGTTGLGSVPGQDHYDDDTENPNLDAEPSVIG